MIELLGLLLSDVNSIVSQTESFKIEYRAKYVCSKRLVTTKNSMTYYIRTCDKKDEQIVNRCTWLANEVGQLYVVEENKKWCSKEKRLYKSAWLYC